jgi:hypothetical protein
MKVSAIELEKQSEFSLSAHFPLEIYGILQPCQQLRPANVIHPEGL